MQQSRRHLVRLGLLYGGLSLTGWKIRASPASGSSDTDSAFYQAAAAKIRPLFEKT